MSNILLNTIYNIKKKIPEQGPLEFFVHHNTLHHYEEMNFFEAVKRAATEYDVNAFMPEEYYIRKYHSRVIKRSELINEIKQFLAKNQLSIAPDIILRLLLRKDTGGYIENQECIQKVQETFCFQKNIFFASIIKEDDGIDLDYHTAPIIYRFLSAYCDYGAASWILEDRQIGMWGSFCRLHKKVSLFNSKYERSVARFVLNLQEKQPLETIQHLLKFLSIEEPYVHDFLLSICIRYKGWAGFIKGLEERPEYIKNKEIIPSFVEFIAICLLCETAAISSFSKRLITVPQVVRVPLHSKGFLENYFRKYQEYKGVENQLEEALPFLTDFNRQEIFHRAYEQSFYSMFLSAYLTKTIDESKKVYKYQVVCCMDDREESFRRYLEMNQNCETYGIAGHFGLNILYKGYFDKTYRALCPINVVPEYKVTESVVSLHRFKHILLRIWGEMKWIATKSSRTLVGGFVQSVLGGVLGVFPFILDVIDPRITYVFKKKISNFFQSAIVTKLTYKTEDGVENGIPLEARVDFAESFLKVIGMRKTFASSVFIMGHGSSSLNNPHKAAYDCGACGGGIGASNARLIAAILNESTVRKGLKSRGIDIPEATRFIGGYHNTCSDEIDFFDITDLKDNDAIQSNIGEIKIASMYESQERCRRFNDIPEERNPEYYLKCVQARSLDLRQPRPEYGHSTNAIFIIGPRSHSRNLFLDRRAFLLSYDPFQDKDGNVLKKLMNAVVPVVSGINLEYYFSFIDNEFYGCGTKLPHNINGLVAVMNGHLSDLRLGLPWQMVEIHQPVRLFLMIVCELSLVEKLFKQPNSFTNLIENEWINVAVDDPLTNKLWFYKGGSFIEFYQSGMPPRYLPRDHRILTSRSHLEFGPIAHGS